MPGASDINADYEVTFMLICIFVTCVILIYGAWPLISVYKAQHLPLPPEESADTNVLKLKELLGKDAEVTYIYYIRIWAYFVHRCFNYVHILFMLCRKRNSLISSDQNLPLKISFFTKLYLKYVLLSVFRENGEGKVNDKA